jgi:hypothetical protein
MSESNNSSVGTADLAEALKNIQSFTAELAATPKYKIEIADRTGHSTVMDLSLEEATEKIIENAEAKARWVFINGEKFEFAGGNFRAQENVQKLQTKLQAQFDPAILLTGMLVGGQAVLFDIE